MRQSAVVLSLLLASALSAQPLEVRSQKYTLSVELPGPGGDTAIQVQVAERDGAVLLSESGLVAKLGEPVRATATAGERTIVVELTSLGRTLVARATIQEKGVAPESFSGSWTIAPPPGSETMIRTREGAMRVGGDVKPPVVLSRVEPKYPEEARKNRVSGIVIVEALIDREGNVKDVVVLKGLPYGLSEAAVEAIKQWKFMPAAYQGEPVDVVFNLTMNFKLGLDGDDPPAPPPPPRPPAH